MAKCIRCFNEYEAEKPIYCCDGRECGCMGQPINPVPFCAKCEQELLEVAE